MAKDPRPKGKRRKPWNKLAKSTRISYLIKYRPKKQKPKGRRGTAAVRRLGRTYKTGGFQRIVESALSRGYSPESAKRIAASVYWKMVRKRGR